MFAALAHAAESTMPVGLIVEERWRDDELAVVMPQRIELLCRSGAGPWGFSFAGFETRWQGPIELELTGSGDYASMDVFSIAAIGLDFGGKDGWIERSLFGLGKIQNMRANHPPTWGAGNGKLVLRGEIAKADAQPKRITIDPSKYAPAGWDGRLWIGLYQHNVGAGKWVKVRIVNALPSGAKLPPEPDEQGKWKLMREHQKKFLQHALKQIEAKPVDRNWISRVAPELRPYAEREFQSEPQLLQAASVRDALETYDQQPPGAEAFLKLAEGFFTQQNEVKTTTDRAAKLNDLLRAWKDGGEVGRDIGCILRLASNAQKIALADVTSGRVATKSGEGIEISAARHEYEGFQIVLTPLAGTKSRPSLAVRYLPFAVTVNPVGYVRIFQDTLVPDPLLDGEIPQLAAGENQPVWVTVYVPPDAKPGVYRGTVTVAADEKKVEIPISVRVWNFDIPKKISLRSSFWMFRDQINRFYHLDEVSLDDYLKWIDFALAHRVNPIDVFEGRCGQLLDIVLDPKTAKPSKGPPGVPNPKPDFSKWDRYLDRMIAGGASTLPLGQSHHHGTFFATGEAAVATPQQIERVRQSLVTLREHYKERGLFDLHYLQLRDETSAPESLNVYRSIKQSEPDIKLLLTAPSPDARAILDIPCPLTPGFNPVWRDEIHKRGGEYWWYVCVQPNDPRWANLFIHQTAAQHRALFWQTWSHDVDGLLYWGMNFWSWYNFEWPKDAKGPTQRFPAKGEPNFVSVPEAPGDGCSMYPGKDAASPLSSIRLEAMRDGEEDYEYFRLLDQLIEKNPSRSTDAKKLRDEARQMVANLTDYPSEGEPYLKIRQRVAEAIEALQREKN